MVEIVIKAIISKEEGRKLIKNTPLELFQKVSDYSRRKGENALNYYHYLIMNVYFVTNLLLIM